MTMGLFKKCITEKMLKNSCSEFHIFQNDWINSILLRLRNSFVTLAIYNIKTILNNPKEQHTLGKKISTIIMKLLNKGPITYCSPISGGRAML